MADTTGPDELESMTGDREVRSVKALKIIGVVLGALGLVAGVILLLVAFGFAQVIKIDNQKLAEDDYQGPYPGTVISKAPSSYGDLYQVRWREPNGKTYTDRSAVFDPPKPKPGDAVFVYVRDGDRADALISTEPALHKTAARIRLVGWLSGGGGLVLMTGCIVALAVGRGRRLRSGPGPMGAPPGWSPRQAPYHQYSPQQNQPQYPQQYPPQQYPPQQYPQQPPHTGGPYSQQQPPGPPPGPPY